MLSEAIAGFIEFLKFFLGLIAQANIVRGNPIRMPNEGEILIGLVHLLH
jgi:hypothetical protein